MRARKVVPPELLTLPTAFYLRPDGLMYQKFRNQFLSFSMYQSEYLRGPRSAQESPTGRGGPRTWGPSLVLMPPPQALCSSCSITTRAAACTACGPWARGTLWTSLWVSRAWLPCLGALTGGPGREVLSCPRGSERPCPSPSSFLPAEGFQSWMWRGLTFLLPFLFFGHVSRPCPCASGWASPCSGFGPEWGPGSAA